MNASIQQVGYLFLFLLITGRGYAGEATITIPTDWKHIDTIDPQSKIIQAAGSPDGIRGVMLSEIDLPEETFTRNLDPLEEATWFVAEGLKDKRFTITSSKKNETTYGKVTTTVATSKDGSETIQAFVFMSGKTAIVLRLYLKNSEHIPSKDPELGEILKSLKIPLP